MIASIMLHNISYDFLEMYPWYFLFHYIEYFHFMIVKTILNKYNTNI